jgi:DnaK suppressor protein
MAAKSKAAPARKPASAHKTAPARKAAKPAKAAPAKKATHAAKPAKSAKPAKTAHPTGRAHAPAHPTKAAKPAVTKAAAKPAAKPAVAAKPMGRAAAAPISKGARPAPAPVPSMVSSIPMPMPQIAKPQPAPVSQQDIAAATEYLMNRSASRSEAPIIVNGRRLPTEEELLKMSDREYMNESQLAFFKFRLQQMEKELLANADETTEHLRETVIVPDPADRATIEEEHALELRTRDRERKLLKKVQSSLARIESGDYGFCEETGDPIGIPRLLARPTATLSLEAQQRREIKQKMFGD